MSEISDFTEKQLALIDWLSLSRYERKPPTEALLAQELNVTDRTLRRWKKLPEIRQAITKRARELLKDNIPEIYGALAREAMKGSFNHIKLSLELAGEYTSQVNVVTWRQKLPPDKDPDEVLRQFADLLRLAKQNANH